MRRRIAEPAQPVEEALANLAEAVELYLDEADDPQVNASPLITPIQVHGAA